MMLVLHILADGDLSLKFQELHTGVSQIPGESSKELLGKVLADGMRGHQWISASSIVSPNEMLLT